MIKSISISAICALVILPVSSFATWQMTSPERTSVIATPKEDTVVPRGLLAHPAYVVYLQKDSLYKNVVSIAKQNNWQVVWKAPCQDWVLTSTQVGGPTFESVMNQVLENYPSLRAIYDNKNNTLTVISAKKGK